MKRIIVLKKGMTIIEAVVAMAIFITAVTLVVGGFVTIVRLQNKSNIMRETQQNARTAIEIIARSARQAESVTVPNNMELNLKMPNDPTVHIIKVENNKLLMDGQKLIASEGLEISPGSLKFIKSGKLLNIQFIIKQVGSPDSYQSDETPVETSVVLEGEQL